ncbi:MAG: hypothetical protein CMM48_00370 [Rhodospirillaceae bacterium]|nr:hypothetical protein [Rhodospirillaceae bacterium]HAA90895.1 hypothetical protein [Rhodospirillaceae bacterium]|tara:strand:+ start:212 stop:601 length:390 start_codon:yes stop_codon:yes gene_type:complete
MIEDYSKFADSFEECDIDPAAFAHRDHVGVAYEMLRRYEFLDAVARYSKCISALAKKAGVAKKFNTTITLAFLSLIAERMDRSENDTFERFMEQNQDLLSSDLLKRWYTPDRLSSDLARAVFLMPNVAA